MKKHLLKIGFLLILLIGILVGCGSMPTNDSSSEIKKENPIQSEENPTTVSPNVTPEKKPEKTPEATEELKKGTLKVYYFDVDQGDSILIQTEAGKNILIDGGNNHKGSQVVGYLRALNIDTIDAMIGTHPDADHIGGLDTVLDSMVVKAVYAPRVTHTTKTYEDFILAVKREGLKLKEAKAGVELGLEGIEAGFIAPVNNTYGNDLNAWSAVLRVSYGANTFLFVGDVEAETEKDILAAGQNVKADVLKVGHHGANTSSSNAFLSAIKPQYAVISVGEDNTYGHPTAAVLQRLDSTGTKVYRTDQLGTILATSNGKEITFSNIVNLSISNVQKEINESLLKKDEVQSTDPSNAATTLKAIVDNPRPKPNGMIHLNVHGMTGANYEAVLHFKSKDTVYTGTVGTPLAIRIGRAAVGHEVKIDVNVTNQGKKYSTQTSFTPQ